MFTLTLQREKRKTSEVFRRQPKTSKVDPKISEIYWRLSMVSEVDPQTFGVEPKSSKEFPMLAQRIRKVSKVHPSILKTNRFLTVLSILLIKYHATFSYNSCFAHLKASRSCDFLYNHQMYRKEWAKLPFPTKMLITFTTKWLLNFFRRFYSLYFRT